jgi:hypothetical protein
VPVEAAGGVSGLFSTAQELGGAIGVALLGTVFFGHLSGHSFEAAIVHTAPYPDRLRQPRWPVTGQLAGSGPPALPMDSERRAGKVSHGPFGRK